MARAFNLQSIIGDTSSGATAAGTTQGGATPLPAGLVSFGTVTSSANGALLRAQGPGTISVVSNADSSDNLKVYPWSGAAINGGTADAPLELPYGRAALFVELTSTKIAAVW